MDFRDRRSLKEAGERALQQSAYDPNRLMLLYAGATAAVMLVVTVLNFLLQQQIAGTGGLSGMGLRAALETGVQVLQMGCNLVLPFWTLGYLACMLRMVRGQDFGPGTMLEGFRHFGSVLWLNLYRGFYFMMLAMMCLYMSMVIFELTPLAQPMMDLMAPQMEAIESGAAADLSAVDTGALFVAMLPMFGIFAVMFVLLAGPYFYRFRMADYALMDNPAAGARLALQRSTLMMKGNRVELLKLDLSFWWFYLLDLLTLGLCYLDLILALAGVALPISADAAWFVFYVLYLAAQLALYLWARNRVESAYAVGYDILSRDLDRRIQELQEQMNQQQ